MDHLPSTSPHEDDRYTVRIAIQDAIGWCRDIRTLEEAQRAYIRSRDTLELCESDFGDGEIYDASGTFIARIDFDGRLWAAAEYRPGDPPLAEAPQQAAAA